MTQLPLDLGHRAALERDDFLVAASNSTAVAWIDRWPEWPGGGLALHGPSGSGKSHLLAVWCQRSGARTLRPRDIGRAGDLPALLGGDDKLAFDEADQAAAKPGCAERLLHLINLIRERRGYLLLAGRRAPARWSCPLPDLASRVAALPVVELGAPDDQLLAGLLVKLLNDRQLRVPLPVLHYLVARMERSAAAAQELVSRLDETALAERREITVPLARRVLEQLGSRAGPQETEEGGTGDGPGNSG